jgi:uncharacterized protein YbaP (TraB family)
MKKISVYSLLLIGLTISCSDNLDDKSGLLWRVTSKDKKIGFIFGTIHLYPNDKLKISNQVLSTLKQCKTLALERNIKDSVDQNIFAERAIRTHAIFRTYQVISDKYGEGLKNMESELITFADSNDIKLTGLETSTELLELMTKVPNIDKGETDEYIIGLYELWLDIYKEELIDYFSDTYLDKELGLEARKLLVDNRNENWLDNIDNLINQDKVFIAVGMGHLGGENGLLNLLKKKGYKLERIKI